MTRHDGEERITERDQQMWDDYVLRNMTQRQIAEKYECSQALVSQRIRFVREHTPQQTRDDIIARRIQQIDHVVSQAYQEALSGDSDKVTDYLKLTEREAKLLGLFTPDKVETDVTVRYLIVDEED